MSSKRFKLLFNPNAGYGKKTLSIFRYLQPQSMCYKHILDFIENEFKSQNIIVDTTIIKDDVDAGKVAAECCHKTYDAIVVAGGDGTINRTIHGLISNPIPLGIIPIGSVNILALELGIPHKIKKACQCIINGNSTAVDLGKVNNHYFACMTGIGFDAKVIKHTSMVLKKAIGLLSFFVVAVKLMLRYKFRPIRFSINQETTIRTAYFLIVNNARYYAGKFLIAKEAKLSDGKLDIMIMKRRNVLYFMLFCVYLVTGNIAKCPWIDVIQVTSINLIENQYHHTHVDAEYIGKQQASIHVVPEAVHVIH